MYKVPCQIFETLNPDDEIHRPMAITSPSAPTFSALFRRNSTPFLLTQSLFRVSTTHSTHTCPLFLTACVNSSSSSYNGDIHYELQHGGLSTKHRREGSPVFVTLPVDVVTSSGQVGRRKAMAQSFRALAATGVEGVVMEVWWGIVEGHTPGIYNWQGYVEIASLARCCGLKVRALMAFQQSGTGPGDSSWIPLPQWVLEEMDLDPDLAYSDRFGRRNMEYISLGCDILPILNGRSPIQIYADFMRSFRDTFIPLFGSIITGIQVGMGPAGELRYPACPSQKLAWPWRSHELGEFQRYDKYMLASLNACARETGMLEWENAGLIGAGNLMPNPKCTEFFKSDGFWNTLCGKFFLEWYSRMLLLHREMIFREAETIFWGTGTNAFGRVGAIHWHYATESHPSELTAGYYNTSLREGYLPITRLFGRFGFTVCCSCFDMRDAEEKQTIPNSSPEGFIRQLLMAARHCNIPLEGENSSTNLDYGSFEQVLKMSKSYSDGVDVPSFSFNFIRMDKNLFENRNWVNFTRFVRQMSDAHLFRSNLGLGGIDMWMSTMPVASDVGAVLAI